MRNSSIISMLFYLLYIRGDRLEIIDEFFILIVNKLGSSAYSTILGIAGLFYGLTGIFKLGLWIDWILLPGSCLILFSGWISKKVIK
jgi:hypothetical protein